MSGQVTTDATAKKKDLCLTIEDMEKALDQVANDVT